MRLTDFTDFGLRALMRLAVGTRDRVFNTDELSRELQISRNHLSKIVGSLALVGFISTQRGSGGGFRLARPAQAITIGAVVLCWRTARLLSNVSGTMAAVAR